MKSSRSGRRALAVELGEVAEHAAADGDAGEGCARGRHQLWPRRGLGPDAPGQGAFQVDRRRDSDSVRANGDALDLALHIGEITAQRVEIVRRLALGIDARQDDLEHELGSECAGKLPIGLGETGVVALACIEGADEVGRPQRPERLDQIECRLGMGARDGQAHGRHPRHLTVVDRDGDG